MDKSMLKSLDGRKCLGQGVTCTLMSNRPNRKPELLVYDTVTNDLPDGISINNVLIRDGFAKKDPKWTKHGLLPWEYPSEQVRQFCFVI